MLTTCNNSMGEGEGEGEKEIEENLHTHTERHTWNGKNGREE